jgi:putative ABC transport system substrate-binding protein
MWCSTVGVIVTLTLSLLAAPLGTDAQRVGKVYRIGWLSPGPPIEPNPALEAFRQGLRDLGYVEGQNLVIEYRYAEVNPERLPDLAAELVRLKPDLIVTFATAGVLAAKQATTMIPIVIAGAGALVEKGIVASLAHPGGNLTGVENNPPELEGKRLELLKEAVPHITRVALLGDPTNPVGNLRFPGLETGARALGLQLQRVEARAPGEFDVAFAAIVASRADALLIEDATIFAPPYHQRILDFAATNGLPSMAGNRRLAEAGGLMAYGWSRREIGRRAAIYVDKILKGAQPGDLPIERASTFELVINLRTAKALGITIPPTLLFLADEVIQ